MAKTFQYYKHLIIRNITYIAFFGMTCIVLFLLAEITLRTHHRIIYNTPLFRSASNVLDKELGWAGKKIFGNPTTDKIKIFIVGDSFTEGMGVPERMMYYQIIKSDLNAELFIYGGAGYGTMQEYLVIDRFLDQIRPDLVLLQVSNNDLINNHWGLERKSLLNNSYTIKPYLIEDRIEYRYPTSLAMMRRFLFNYSRIFLVVISKIESLLANLAQRGILPTIEHVIQKKGETFKSFQESISVTGILIGKIKERVGTIPIVAFSAYEEEPYSAAFKNIFGKLAVPFIEDVPPAIVKQASQGKLLTLSDGMHWNEEGQKVVGEVLSHTLRLNKYIIFKTDNISEIN